LFDPCRLALWPDPTRQRPTSPVLSFHAPHAARACRSQVVAGCPLPLTPAGPPPPCLQLVTSRAPPSISLLEAIRHAPFSATGAQRRPLFFSYLNSTAELPYLVSPSPQVLHCRGPLRGPSPWRNPLKHHHRPRLLGEHPPPATTPQFHWCLAPTSPSHAVGTDGTIVDRREPPPMTECCRPPLPPPPPHR
jgi:hypothetical protein